MKYKILRGFCLGHGIDAEPGTTKEIADHQAALLIQQGKIALPTPEDQEALKPAAKRSNPHAS